MSTASPHTSDYTLTPGSNLPARSAISLRSVLLGLTGVAFISLLTPYNDYVLNNTRLIGNFLPVGLLLFYSFFLLVVNGPLWKWRPHLALSSGELGVSLAMTLMSCGVVSSGLIRYLPSALVGVWYHAGQIPDYRRALLELNLPEWIFPKFESNDQAAWSNDPVVMHYYLRSPPGEGVPWQAWMQPLASWGIFLAALGAAIVCMAEIVRRQWAENERLPFPLADVYLSLIETPRPGKALNPLLSSRMFWYAMIAVFVIHGANALNKYFPKNCPQIPISYDLSSLFFGNAPWWYMDWAAPRGTLYFSIIGITFFLQSKVAFSLWVFYVLFNVVRIMYGVAGSEFSGGMQTEQTFGAIVAYALAILWIGRSQWALVARQMFRGPRPSEPVGRYLPYPFAGWGLIVSIAVMCVWLKMAGASVVGAMVLIATLLMMLLVLARVVAETGMIYVQCWSPLGRPWVLLGSLPGLPPIRTTGPSYFYSSLLSGIFGDTRESLPVFASHAMRVTDKTVCDEAAGNRKSALSLTGLMILALLVGFFVSGAMMLKTEYAYSTTVDRNQYSPINGWAMGDSIRWNILDAVRDYRPPGTGPRESHNRLAYFGSGAVITAILSFLRLRFVNWPLHPVGLLLVYTYPIRMVWFSVFVGWIAKVLIVRFGGVELMRGMRPVFLGLIIGEAGAAAFWLVVSLVLHSMGIEFQAINLLPQ